MKALHDIVKRHPSNPILTAASIPYPATLVFNAGITKYQGTYVMAFRNDIFDKAGDPDARTGSKQHGTNIGVAFSDDGVTWTAKAMPWIEWKTDEIRRAYDPRITVIGGTCYLCFAVDTRHGIRGGIAVTEDFEGWEVLSLSAPDNRNMVLFPELVDGKFMRLERPFPVYGRGGPENFDIWFSDSTDCRYWGNTQLVLGSEQVPFANCKIGPGAPPVLTSEGWLTLFHAVYADTTVELPAWHRNWYKTYVVGLALLDKERPWVLKGMCRQPLMVPELDYELKGYRGSVLFPGGMILEDSGEVKIYYGAADTVECLATAHVDDLLGLCEPFPAH